MLPGDVGDVKKKPSTKSTEEMNVRLFFEAVRWGHFAFIDRSENNTDQILSGFCFFSICNTVIKNGLRSKAGKGDAIRPQDCVHVQKDLIIAAQYVI